ncbi:MAG: hypothetical protein GY770_35525 [Aestuariibacter sp.]|nr:hypothetical protein [Aestuariibacter sp.]
MRQRENNWLPVRLMVFFTILALTLTLGGCFRSKSASSGGTLFEYLSTTKDSTAFGENKIYGIVSITAVPQIFQIDSDGSLLGAFSTLASDRDFFQNSQKILDKSTPVIVDSMARTKQYLLMPPISLLDDPAYVSAQEESNSAFDYKNIAQGYKRISQERRLAQLARSLGMDGAIHVDVTFGYSIDGTNIIGLVDFGKNYATVKINVTAVDTEARIVWKASESSIASKPVTTETEFGSAVDFKQLEPHLMESLRSTLGKVMDDLGSE